MRLAGIALHARGVCQETRYRTLAPLRAGLPELLADDAPFAGLSPAQVRDVTQRFAASNDRFVRDYRIDGADLLFREHPADSLRRPSSAEWADLSESERTRVRQFVREAVRVDLPIKTGLSGRSGSHLDGGKRGRPESGRRPAAKTSLAFWLV